MTTGLRPLTAALAVAGLLVAGCSTTTGGAPTAANGASRSTATSAAAPMTTTTTSAEPVEPGLRADAPAATVTVIQTVPSPVNAVAGQAISDASDYWKASSVAFTPPQRVEAMAGPEPRSSCMKDMQIARRCENGIGWAVPDLEAIDAGAGDLGVLAVLAHEVGHEVQDDNGKPISELGADCLSGFPLQRVVDGESSRFAGTRAEVIEAAQKAMTYAASLNGLDTDAIADQVAERIQAVTTGMDATSPSVCFTYS